jgi:hypothetical protein
MGKYLTRNTLAPTLAAIKPGERLYVRNSEFRSNTVRQAVSRINRDARMNMRLRCSEAGDLDGITVWREK